MLHLKKYLKCGSDSKHIPLPSQWPSMPDEDVEGYVLINAADFTCESFQLLINSKPEKAYKKFHKLKVAYDECQICHAEVQAKYAADLSQKTQIIADLEMQLEKMKRSRDQEAIISRRMLHDTGSSGITQSVGTYGGLITTSSGHVRQGNDLTGKLSTCSAS